MTHAEEGRGPAVWRWLGFDPAAAGGGGSPAASDHARALALIAAAAGALAAAAPAARSRSRRHGHCPEAERNIRAHLTREVLGLSWAELAAALAVSVGPARRAAARGRALALAARGAMAIRAASGRNDGPG